MTWKTPLLPALVCACAAQGLSAATITLNNTNFNSDAVNANPASWTTTESAAGGLSVQNFGGTGSLGRVLTFQDRSGANNLTQSVSTTEATADTFGTWTVTFGDSGWRNFSTGNTSFSGFTVSLIDLDNANAVLASDSVVLARGVGNGSNIWEDLGSQVFNLSYDNTAAGLVGHEVAVVIESDATGNNFTPTAYIDNISVVAVPEPGSLALLGLGGLLIARRRRG